MCAAREIIIHFQSGPQNHLGLPGINSKIKVKKLLVSNIVGNDCSPDQFFSPGTKNYTAFLKIKFIQ